MFYSKDLVTTVPMGNFRDVLRDIILYNVTLALTLVGSNVIHPPLFFTPV